ncbi:nuclear transport factor 2 family protein [Streptomyces sp. NPDC001698]|uniref:nuclear transport factor 2 family protein n=1 Tax=unclassified Streptomyces TaxID=2593676 RepID=UPI0036C085B8
MTLQRLMGFGEAWRQKDLELLMEFMTDDCVFRSSVGPEPGMTFRGRAEVRRGFELMLAYDEGLQPQAGGAAFIAGDRGASQWSFTGTDANGQVHEVHGCDMFEFDGDRIRVKDAYRRVRGDIGLAAAD